MVFNFKKAFSSLLNDGNALKRNEDGQIIVFTALAGLVLVMMVATIFNVGIVVGEKMKVQNAADAAAYSQAVWEARVLNFIAYTNRAIVSHMVTIAWATAVFSHDKLWQAISYTIPTISSIPIIGWILGPMMQAYVWFVHFGLRPVASAARPIARWWIDIMLVYQTMIMAELGVRTVSGTIPERIAREYDSGIRVNSGGWKRFLNYFNLYQISRVTGWYPWRMNFSDIRGHYRRTAHRWTQGRSILRELRAPSVPLIPLLLRLRIGVRGDWRIRLMNIRQSENFYIELGWRNFSIRRGFYWSWSTLVSVPTFLDIYPEPQLGVRPWWNYQMSRNFFGRLSGSIPSVYVWAEKSGGQIPQIRLLGIDNTRDIHAFARAEVFYWDPDRDRSRRLRNMSPPREPNLFNPFWHARLARTDAILGPIRLGGLTNLLPLTH